MSRKIQKIATAIVSCVMMATVFVPSLSMFAYAETSEPVSETETTTAATEEPTTESSAVPEVSLPIELVTVDPSVVQKTEIAAETTESQTIPKLPALTAPEAENNTPKKDKYHIVLSLYNSNQEESLRSKEVTLTIRVNGKKQKVEFTKENNYFVNLELPVGTYEIEKVKSDSRYVKLALNSEKIIVGTTDYQSMSFEVTEKEMPFLLEMLVRNWLYMVILIGLFIALHKYNQKQAG